MRSDDRVLEVVREWLGKAQNDLLTATHTLKLGRRCPTDTVCFHAQQCAEKHLKALLVLRGIDFPKTHDLEVLAARLRNGPKPALSPDELARLKRYATVTRYPGAEAIPLAEARRAVAAARRIRKAVRTLLPRAAVRSVRKG
jgi:HEPN domain-containing protein